jgi:hypothetical protein
MSSPTERIIKPGFEKKAPRTPDEFAQYWKDSPERKELLLQIDEYDRSNPLTGDGYVDFAQARKLEKSKNQREISPYNLSYWGQVKLNLGREYQKLKNDPR